MRWSYKTVHYELKKEGLLGSAFLDESEVEISFNEYGRAGWELVSILETMDGIIAVFKQPISLDSSSFLNIESESGAHDKAKYEPPTDISAKETESKAVEDLTEDEVSTEESRVVVPVFDDFEVVKVDPETVKPVEKKTLPSKREVGTIRIE